jgi:uncharacterized membrane protein
LLQLLYYLLLALFLYFAIKVHFYQVDHKHFDNAFFWHLQVVEFCVHFLENLLIVFV